MADPEASDGPRRRARAIALLALALGFAYAVFTPQSVPLLPFALTLLALSASRAAYEAVKEQRDERSGVSFSSADAQAELAAGHATRAVTISRAALEVARSRAQRRKLWATLAWAGIGEQDPFLTHLALQNLPAADIDLHLLAAYLSCCNRNAEAEALLQEARAAGQRSPETSKQLIELSFARGDRAAVRALARADAELLSTSERSRIALALASPTEEACAHSEAAAH